MAVSADLLNLTDNTNNDDFLALERIEGFSSELTLTIVGCPGQEGYAAWTPNSTMRKSKMGSMK